jgi:phenylacetate-CoA ligase
MLAPEVEIRPWAEQLAVDDQSYRIQLAYLFDRSAFYREKLAAAGFASDRVAGGLADIAQLPLTEKAELRATCTPDNPIGAHLCVPPSEIVRIYSTSGTTGAPSYVPLTAADLDNWMTASARSYAASGVETGQRIVSTYNAGPFVAGAALGAFERIGLCHIPVGTGNTERLMQAVELLRPEAVVPTPSYAAYLVEWAAERNVELRASSVERVLVAGEPGGGEPGFRAKLEEGWGARVTEAMGIGDIGVSLWGECEERDGMHLGARGFVHAELIEPETGVALAMDDGASGELVLTHLQQRAAPLLRFRTRDHVRVRAEPVQLRPHEPANPVHRANRRHAHRPRGQRLSLGRPRGGERVRAGGQRPHLRQVPGAGREAGAAASGHRRARAGRNGRCRPGGSDSREAAQRPRRSDTRGVGAVGELAPQRIQVETCRALIQKLQSQGVRDRDSRRAATDIGCVYHIAFSLSQATFQQAVERLDERKIRHSGVKDRGFIRSIAEALLRLATGRITCLQTR